VRYNIEVGSPLFSEPGPRQGTTEIKFRGSVFLEPDEMDNYYKHGLVVRVGADSEPFNPGEQDADPIV
jgi:hypothetical protein